jgi:hypothetical protein
MTRELAEQEKLTNRGFRAFLAEFNRPMNTNRQEAARTRTPTD